MITHEVLKSVLPSVENSKWAIKTDVQEKCPSDKFQGDGVTQFEPESAHEVAILNVEVHEAKVEEI